MESLTYPGLCLALKQNIEAFKRIKTTKEKAPIQESNHILHEEKNKKEQTPPQTNTHLEPTIPEEKKEDNERKEVEKSKNLETVEPRKDISSSEKIIQKRRLIEGTKLQPMPKEEDITTKAKNESEHFINYMADIPLFLKLSNKEILKRKEDLWKRHIKIWATTDTTSKRLRVVKQLQ